MTASQATNTAGLPRAVLKISENVQRRLEEQRADHARLTAEPPVAPALVADPQAPPADPAAPAAPAADPRESDPAYWKHRFLTVDGVLRRQATAHNDQVAASNQRITELQEQVRTLQSAVPTPAPDITKFFTPEEIEKYGPEQCAVMLRGSDALAKDRIAKAIETEIQPIRDAAQAAKEEAAAKTKREGEAEWQGFLDRIEVAHPGFKVTDQTEGWWHWLDAIDPITDAPRRAVLNEHLKTRAVAPIVRMLKGYEQSTRPPAPPVAPHGDAGNGGGEAPAPQVAPGGAPTDKEVKDFFTRAAIGKVTAEQRTAFEARMKLRVPQR